MNRMLLLLLVMFILGACGGVDREKLRQDFSGNSSRYNLLKDVIRKLYVDTREVTGQKVFLLDCRVDYTPQRNEICMNSGILQQMKLLGVKKMWLESTECDQSPRYDKLYVQTSAEEAAYLFDFCEGAPAENSAHKESLEQHWSLVIFPKEEK